MGKINVGRLILGGIVAGIAIDLLDYFVDGVWLAQRWADWNGPAWPARILADPDYPVQRDWTSDRARGRLGLCGDPAAIRRGHQNGDFAGLAVWILTVLFPNLAFMHVAHLFSNHLTLYTTLGGLVEAVFGTVAGASVYRES
jgi:hypothetical protein